VSVFDDARINMIESQLRPSKVTDERVIDAFARIRRELFVPPALRAMAYIDDNLPVSGARYLMQPMVAARLLQAAAVKPKDVVLVVGAGVGYEAALLAMARDGRSALVDHRIASVNYVEETMALGHKARAPYDVIVFGGGVTAVPSEITAQLAEHGRLVVVSRPHERVGHATLITRAGGVLAQRVIFDAVTPLLPGFGPKPGFVF
jgi:protein-L-isoaspartate(D-aspartate) O-methyltransferase